MLNWLKEYWRLLTEPDIDQVPEVPPQIDHSKLQVIPLRLGHDEGLVAFREVNGLNGG